MKAYHFVDEKLRDGRPIPQDGEWLVHDGDLELCESGLHASLHPFDALTYAPGSTLCLVELDGKIIEGDDKVVAERRRIIKRVNIEKQLRKFARDCALSVIHLWDAPDVVREYLETGREDLRDAANAAARSAANAAASTATRDAARAATRDAARATWAAWAAWAALAAVRGASAVSDLRDAERSARDEQKSVFKKLIDEALGESSGKF